MRRVFILTAIALMMIAVLAAAPKKKRKEEPLALIGGTVFQATGFSFPGVNIFAVSRRNPKIKADAVTGRRGEFALRVPAAAGPYLVTAQAKGFAPQEKTLDVYEGTKTTVTFQLKPLQEKSKEQ